MTRRRVVVTGLGAVSPLGLDVASNWDAAMNGRSGLGPITRFDASDLSTRIAGEVRGFDPADWMPAKDVKKMDVFAHYGVAAGVQALRDAGLSFHPEHGHRFGVAMGSAIGGIVSLERHAIALSQGTTKISPFFVPGVLGNMAAGYLSILAGLRGPNLAVATACASSSHTLGLARRIIADGEADVMLAGGSEGSIGRLPIAGHIGMRALSARNEDPQAASRPWDRGRDGFVMSEGAGVVVLEDYDHARARGALIHAELLGVGMSGDGYHVTSPSEGGEGAARCIVAALADARLDASAIDYINAHGTSTPVGDRSEAAAIHAALGVHASRVMVSSTKSMTGHLLGAAGGLEAVFSVLSLIHQCVPPTLNLDDPDEGLNLDLVPHIGRQARVSHVLSNSFGFGGTNGCLVFRRAP